VKRYDRSVFSYGEKPAGKQCKTCMWYGDRRCDMFTFMNNHQSNFLDLDIHVKPTDGCTMMQTNESSEREERLAEAEL
jgi:hypothetical protein